MNLAEPPAPSWSQSGEDRIVHFLFERMGSVQHLTYADLGAAFPAGHNNTYLFYTLEGSGLLVEADPAYLPMYQQFRPRDRVEQVAVVPRRLADREFVEFYTMDDPGWSTVSTEHAAVASALNKGGIKATLRVPCITINDLLGRHFPDGNLDLLSMDLEGVDAELLEELDLRRFRPQVIIVENQHGWDPQWIRQARGAANLMTSGYVMFACTFVNYIFVRQEALQRFKV